VDLSLFQFDYDLNWAAMFINADGVVYGRYGTQSADGPDAFNSIGSLEKAMRRVLALHAGYPKNKTASPPSAERPRATAPPSRCPDSKTKTITAKPPSATTASIATTFTMPKTISCISPAR